MTTTESPSPATRLIDWLSEPVDNRGPAVFRIVLGVIFAWSALRFLLNGWVEQFFGRPTYFFDYAIAPWVEPLSLGGMRALFVIMTVAGLFIALGFFYRFAALTYLLVFSYVELTDVTNYLNHYYLVSLLALGLVCFPLHRRWSIDAWLRPGLRGETVPRYVVLAFRAQLAIVYFFAAMAKFTPDWLLHAQPMNIWLGARTHVPLIGGYFQSWYVALAMSWAGFLYDLTIWIWLSWPRTRPFAYLLVLSFHTMTGLLFNIGMFPVIMTGATIIFFAPDWPLRVVTWFRRRSRDPDRTAPRVATGLDIAVSASPRHRIAIVLLASYFVLQLALPTRAWFYGGDVLWHEQGMRWSWRVMCREKNGAVTYIVEGQDSGRRNEVPPSRYLTAHQEREMSGQPDLIVQLAHDVGDEYAARWQEPVRVFVDARASLNGRAPQALIDPEQDLMEVRPGLRRAVWILQGPQAPPPHLYRTR